jgi:hypothetical protein
MTQPFLPGRSLLCTLTLGLALGACGSDPASELLDATTLLDTGGAGDASTFDVLDDAPLDAVPDAVEPDVVEPDTGEGDAMGPDVVIPPGCGNGVIDEGEACDDGDDNGNAPDACRPDCTLPACGDGIVDSDEACDDGDENADGVPDACRLDCALPACGDGIVDSGEACDDANDDDTDACGNACVIAGADVCTACTDDAECGREADRCTALGDASFCTIACGADGACPEGTTCNDDADGAQCVPDAGSCDGCIDGDGDGYGIGEACLGFDCNEDSALAFVGADEICDGIDNDCDGAIDTNAVDAVAYYVDADDDGFGDPDAFLVGCGPSDAFVVTEGGDCDDADDTISPGVADICDGIDNDCSEDTPDGLNDPLAGFPCDGLDEDLCPSGRTTCVNEAIACVEDADDLIEVCDGFDNDCDPSTLDGSQDPLVGAPCDGDDSDLCQEGTATCTDGALFCDDFSDDSIEICNGADDDCDGVADNDALDAPTWFEDGDGDFFGTDEGARVQCLAPAGDWVADGGDCNDDDDAVFPTAAEICNGVDDNCDGGIDVDAEDAELGFNDADGDGFGPDETGMLYCDLPPDVVLDGGDCDESDETGFDVNPAAAEVCDDGIDNDCDGRADCLDTECASLPVCVDLSCVTELPIVGVGPSILTGTNVDAGDDTAPECVGGNGAGGQDIAVQWTVPVTGQYTINTIGSDFDTVLYLLDRSCDGESLICNDDAFGGSGGGPGGLLSQVTPPLEAGQNVIIVIDAYGGADGDFVLNIALDADEICDNGIDDDLNGAIDCLDAACGEVPACQEICDNGIDDNGDDLTDCEDPICDTAIACRPDSCGVRDVGFATGVAAITGNRIADEWGLACGPAGGNDDSFTWRSVDYEGFVSFTAASEFGTPAVSLLSACDEEIVSCEVGDETVAFVEPGDELILVVDSLVGGGAYSVDVAIDEAQFCTNGIDEDLDGDVDCEDSDCFGDEACIAAFCPLDDLESAVGLEIVSGSTTGLPDIVQGGCASNTGPDAVYLWTAPAAGVYEFNTLGSTYDTLLFLTTECGGSQLTCNDDGPDYVGTDERLRSQVERTFEAGEQVAINITGYAANTGDYVLNIIQAEVCDDGIDNDFDGAADCEDFDCGDVTGCFEVCDNGIDDDGDEAVDCNDPECFGVDACIEICDNAIDDNLNGATDCDDLDCATDPICCEADVFEPNTGVTGEPSTTLDVFLATPFDALTLPTGDVDSFRIPTCPGARVTATATFTHADGDVQLRLLNQFGQLLQESVSDTDDEALDYTVTNATVVFVQAYSGEDTGVCASYDLELSVTGCEP